MAARDRIKTYQRRIAQLDAVYQRAQEHLDDQQHKRADLIATQDQLVSEAQRAVEEAIATMAGEIGSELTAHLVGADPREVRRMFKRTTAEATLSNGDLEDRAAT